MSTTENKKRSPKSSSNGDAVAASSTGNSSNGIGTKHGNYDENSTAEERQMIVQEQVRSLRRRLWRAFQNGDPATALKAYNATAKDLRKWVRDEIKRAKEKEELRIQQEKERKEAQRPAMLKKLGIGNTNDSKEKKQQQPATKTRMSFLKKADTDKSPASPGTDKDIVRDLIMIKTDNDNTALLPLHMNPSEPFLLDDYQDPTYDMDHATGEIRCLAATNPYDGNSDNSNNTQNQKLNSSLKRKSSKRFRKRKGRRESQQPRTTASNFWATIMERRGRASREAATVEQEDPSEGQTETETNNNDETTVALNDPRMTTPLHEAARLGDATLVQLMLAHPFVEPNFKNGVRRTALHMVAGGWTEQEERLWRARQHKIETKLNHKKKQQQGPLADSSNAAKTAPLGIGTPLPVKIGTNEMSGSCENGTTIAGAKKAAKAMSKFFQTTFTPTYHKEQRNTELKKQTDEENSQSYIVWDEGLWTKLKTNRMDCLLAILSWCHPDDGSNSAGEGASVNAVDAQGRTALHYAAELGREDVCMAILSSFGAMLTVVDDSARTPCELAAEQNHPELAAQLEARALLYTDPYGMDDELLAAVLAEQQIPDDDDMNVGEDDDPELVKARKDLVAPFSWFRTITMEEVDKERLKRLGDCCGKMMAFVTEKEKEKELNDALYSMKLDESEEENDPIGKTKMKARSKTADGGTGSSGSGSSVVSWESDSEDDWLATNVTGWESGDKKAKKRNAKNGEQEQAIKVKSDVSDLPEEKENGVKTVGRDEEKMPEDNISSLKSLQNAHVVQFLAHHGWVVEKALDAFKKNPVKAVEEAQLPLVQLHRARQRVASNDEGLLDDSTRSNLCLICFDEFDPSNTAEWTNLENCSHSFCNDCLGDYLQDCANSRSSGLSVLCPHHECPVSMSPNEVRKVVPNDDVYSMLQKTANENFISSATDIRFCSHPGCAGIVKIYISRSMKRWGVDHELLGSTGAVCTAVHDRDEATKALENAKSNGRPIPLTYEGVIDPTAMDSRSQNLPKKAHRFCFSCGDSKYHFPVSCDLLEEWKKKMDEEIEQVKGDDDQSQGDAKYDDIAQRLWMRANTRPCPKCKAPIEKHEGCNHMTCSNPQCKHEFCWICRKDWKLHNTATGGFFRCNRWQEEEDTHDFYDKPPSQDEATPTAAAIAVAAQNPEASTDEIMNSPEVMAQTYGTAMHASRVAYRKAKEMKRFLHHYTRWNAHMESAALEKLMSENVCIRLAPVIDAAADFTCDAEFNFDGKGLSFVHAAFKELLECRSILQHSYAFSFFRFAHLSSKKYRHNKRLWNEKQAFEQMQAELEIITEQMSDIVARTHLRATQTQIQFLTVGASERRGEFTNLIFTLMNEERKRKRENADRKKRGKHSHGYARSHAAAADTFVQSLVQAGLQPEDDDDDNETGQHRQESGAHQAVREALRASLESFMANTEDATPTFVAHVDRGEDNFTDDNGSDGDGPTDWACLACTYVNSSGRMCAMCGTPQGTVPTL